ncbi:rhamnogalacturonan acetylesterase [Desertihabitans aurantiacus]|uniref:rhamnogalacturonan acetylesterase n=1 Tax=Desertihabitans aurantiacus TaxID=2282477 RepID=UPI000DF85B3F|nr:rhamnogalacturonan acetylesterase [Desertihabitans aurantiacus]
MSTARQTVHIAGDSTAAPKTAAVHPEAGWGMALPFYLDPAWQVANHAVNGRSSKSFIDEGRLAVVLAEIRPGDVLIVQFGHNDAKVDDPSRCTEPWTSYREHLAEYVRGARAADALPVLVTSVERRSFDPEGRALPTHGDYPEAMRTLARDLAVPLIDVQVESLALWQQLGPEATLRWFLHTDDGRRDDTHFSPLGASAVAAMVARGLDSTAALPAGAVRRLTEDVPVSWFTWSEYPA